MQHIYTIDWKRFSLLIGTTRIFAMTREILTNSSCWKSTISIHVLYRAFQAHFQVSGRNQIEVIYIQPLTAFAFQMISNAKVRFFLRIIANHC